MRHQVQGPCRTFESNGVWGSLCVRMCQWGDLLIHRKLCAVKAIEQVEYKTLGSV